MCQPGTNGVDGSTIRQACSTKSRKLRVASSRSIFARMFGLANQDAELFEFFIAEDSQFRRGANGKRRTIWTAVFVSDVILVVEKILGEENRGGNVSLRSLRKQHPAHRYPAPRSAALDRI